MKEQSESELSNERLCQIELDTVRRINHLARRAVRR